MKIALAIPTVGNSCGEIPAILWHHLWSQQGLPDDIMIQPLFTERVLINKSRDALLRAAQIKEADYLWFVDADTIPPFDALSKMIKLDKDIVCNPVLDRNGEGRIALFDDKINSISQIYETCKVGFGGMSNTLIKRKVIDAMLKAHEDPFDNAVVKVDDEYHKLGEDMSFVYRAKQLGFEIWACHDIRPFHMGAPTYWQYKPDESKRKGKEPFVIFEEKNTKISDKEFYKVEK
jgi:hypothetical protein